METDINVLMSLDPLGMTKDGPEIAAIVKYFADKRSAFNAAAFAPKAAKPVKESPVKLSLKDLGL